MESDGLVVVNNFDHERNCEIPGFFVHNGAEIILSIQMNLNRFSQTEI